MVAKYNCNPNYLIESYQRKYVFTLLLLIVSLHTMIKLS